MRKQPGPPREWRALSRISCSALLESVSDAAFRCRPDEANVLAQHATGRLQCRRRPRRAPRRKLLVADVDAQLTRHRVDDDAVAVAHERDWTALLRLRRDVANDKSVRAA